MSDSSDSAVAFLLQWFLKPDFDVFTPYVHRRRLRPEQPFYILHPEFIWSLWDLIQDNSEDAIQPNPPSSGFTGSSRHRSRGDHGLR